MEKLFKISVVLSILMMLFSLIACSNASGSGGGSSRKTLAVYKSSSDTVTIYDDKTWVETWDSDCVSYANGTYKM